MAELSKTQKAALLCAHNNDGELHKFSHCPGYWGPKGFNPLGERYPDQKKTFGSRTINQLDIANLVTMGENFAFLSVRGREVVAELLLKIKEAAHG